jgi:hypothetical protein
VAAEPVLLVVEMEAAEKPDLEWLNQWRIFGGQGARNPGSGQISQQPDGQDTQSNKQPLRSTLHAISFLSKKNTGFLRLSRPALTAGNSQDAGV